MSSGNFQSNAATRRNFAASLLLLIGLSYFAACQAAAADGDVRPPSFRQVVEKNFAIWDRNSDGMLSAQEIDQLVTDPQVTGCEAAAVAAIHRFLGNEKAPASFSESDLLQTSSPGAAPPVQSNGRRRLARDYSVFCRHLRRAPREVFANDGGPARQGIAQGRLGDCFLVATLGAALERDPRIISRMLSVQGDGSIDVSFPNGKHIRVQKPTDAEIALGSNTAGQGLWLNVLEKAYAALLISMPATKQVTHDVPLDVIARGGSARQVISTLTGHETDLIPIRHSAGDFSAPSADQLPALRERIHNVLIRGSERGLLMCAATAPKGKVPPGMGIRHEYAILSYDAQGQVVHLWNPWGHKFTPKRQPAGIENGYPTVGGEFEVPLDEFVQIFRGIHRERADAIASK